MNNKNTMALAGALFAVALLVGTPSQAASQKTFQSEICATLDHDTKSKTELRCTSRSGYLQKLPAQDAPNSIYPDGPSNMGVGIWF